MNKTRKVMTAVVSALAIAALATGCGKKENSTALDKNTIYSEEALNIAFPEGMDINNVALGDDAIFFNGYYYDDVNYTSENVCGSVKYDGSDYCEFNLDLKDGWTDKIFALDNGNVALFYSVSYSDYSGGGDEGIILYSENGEEVVTETEEDTTDIATDDYYYDYVSNYYVSEYTPEGKEVKTVCLSDEYNVSWTNSVNILSNGNIFLNCSEEYIILDADLNLVKEVESNEFTSTFDNFYTLKDGSPVVEVWGEEGEEYHKFDIDTFEVGDKLDFQINTYNYSVCQGNSQYDFILTDTQGMYGFNVGDTAATTIINFVNSDVMTSNFMSLKFNDDNSFYGTYYDWYTDDDMNYKICKYTKVDPADVKEKQNITLGCLYLDSEIRKNIINFNKTSDEYRIVATDYSQYSTEEDYDASTKKFNSDIASGQAPDIVVGNYSTDFANYINKGLFLDLTKYVQDDTDIDYDDIFPGLLEACSVNGKLYEIVPSFYVSTVVGKASKLNGKTSWTFDEFADFKNSLSEGTELFTGFGRSELLTAIMNVDAADFIDFKNAKTSFDSDEFISMLNVLKDMEELADDYWMNYEYDESAYRQDRVALIQYSISSLSDYVYLTQGTFGEDVSFIGYPCAEGNGSVIVPSSIFAISSKCKNADAAWQFVRNYLLKDYQDQINYNFPALMSRYDEIAEEAEQLPYYMDGDTKIEYHDTYYLNGQEIELNPITVEEAASFKEYLKGLNKTMGDYDDITNIITEEADAFFEGQKTAEDVAKIIQSRASIYVNEKQ